MSRRIFFYLKMLTKKQSPSFRSIFLPASYFFLTSFSRRYHKMESGGGNTSLSLSLSLFLSLSLSLSSSFFLGVPPPRGRKNWDKIFSLFSSRLARKKNWEIYSFLPPSPPPSKKSADISKSVSKIIFFCPFHGCISQDIIKLLWTAGWSIFAPDIFLRVCTNSNQII